jgi:anthranilate synthase component 2
MNILIIDNYDSFTYNLAQIVEEYGSCHLEIIKNDLLGEVQVSDYDKILISPGPGLPSDIPILANVINKFAPTKSILGVCLGHQAIAEVFGGGLINLSKVSHGISKEIEIIDKNEYLFKKLPEVLQVALYHSWAVTDKNFPEDLKITARSKDGIIMAISHKQYDLKGIQFHPESIMTKVGRQIIYNWLGH